MKKLKNLRAHKSKTKKETEARYTKEWRGVK
jgi:hypothetical protein